MLFGPSKARNVLLNSLSISINNLQLPFKGTHKNLGLTLDTDLRFREHVAICTKRAYTNLKFLYSHKEFLNQKSKIMLCDSLVLSHYNFADSIYGPCLDSLTSRRIQKTQNSCLRFIFGIKRRNRISHKLRDAEWLNMFNRRKLHLACTFHKIMLFKNPPYLYNKISFRTDVHNINIRNRGNVTIPKHKTHKFRRSFSYQIAHIYNSSPVGFRELSIGMFKRHYYEYLLQYQ